MPLLLNPMKLLEKSGKRESEMAGCSPPQSGSRRLFPAIPNSAGPSAALVCFAGRQLRAPRLAPGWLFAALFGFLSTAIFAQTKEDAVVRVTIERLEEYASYQE